MPLMSYRMPGGKSLGWRRMGSMPSSSSGSPVRGTDDLGRDRQGMEVRSRLAPASAWLCMAAGRIRCRVSSTRCQVPRTWHPEPGTGYLNGRAETQPEFPSAGEPYLRSHALMRNGWNSACGEPQVEWRPHANHHLSPSPRSVRIAVGSRPSSCRAIFISSNRLWETPVSGSTSKRTWRRRLGSLAKWVSTFM
jgi:hypothetical protein